MAGYLLFRTDPFICSIIGQVKVFEQIIVQIPGSLNKTHVQWCILGWCDHICELHIKLMNE